MRRSPVSFAVPSLAALLLPAGRATAGSVFNYLDTPVDVSPAAGSWEAVDASTWIPAGATGVILRMVNTNTGTSYQYGVRKMGSSDTWMLTLDTAVKGGQSFYMIGVNASRQFEVFAENAAVETWLTGYTMPGVTFLDDGVNVSLGSTNTWETIDITPHTQGSDVAIGAIFVIKSNQNKKIAIRMKGSSDDRYTQKTEKTCTGVWIGVDANEQCEMKIEHTDIDAFLVGYVTNGAVFFQDAVDKSSEIKDSYQPVDISADVASGDVPNGALLETASIDGSQKPTNVRPNGSNFDEYWKVRYSSAATGVDGDDVFELKINDTKMDHYLVGYTLLDVNYRSIGTDTATLYSTGNASISAASRTVTFGGGADLPTNIGQGDQLSMGGDTFFILSRDSATQVTIEDYADTTHTNVGYTIKRAYPTLQDWENGRDGDLAGEQRREIGVCYNDGPFTSEILIDGSTTDELHYMHLTVAEGQRHDGTAGTGAVLDAATASEDAIRVGDQYTVVEWLRLKNFKAGTSADGCELDDTLDSTGSRLQHLLIHDFVGGGNGIRVEADATIRNTIIYDGRKGVRVQDGAAAQIDNVTIYGLGNDGVDGTSGNVSVKNVISVGNVTDFDIDCTIDYFGNNMFSTTSGFNPDTQDGGNQDPPADLENLFNSTTGGSEDLHLEDQGHAASDTGLDLSADFTDDIDGETRVAPWDIGADWHATAIYYRSIGTKTGKLYDGGKAWISADSNIVTFTNGADLPDNLGPGDELDIDNTGTFYILTRDSNTQVTIQGVSTIAAVEKGYEILRAYNKLRDWETDRQGDLVGENCIEVGVCYNDANPFKDALTIDGSTTDADHYLKLTVAETQRHDGTPGTGARLDADGGVGDNVITVNDDFTVIEWLEITNFQDNKAAIKTANGIEATLQYLLIHDYDSLAAAIEMYHGGAIRNCIFFDGDSGIFLNMATDGRTGVIENCTIYGLSWEGVKAWAGDYPVEIRNVISVGNGNDDFDLQNDTIAYFGYNLFDPANITGFTLPQDGGHQTPPGDLDDLFLSITPGSEDLHLEDEGHFAMETGLDLSADFVMDIDGQARLAPWDIGADWNPISTNYRSIGTDTDTLYSYGDATVALNSCIVTFGSGADLPTNIGQGDELVIGAETFYILSRESATQVTTQLPAATAHSGDSYTIKRVYNTLQAWEDDRDGDLAAENRREIGVCYNDGWFTNPLTISGSTTDYGHYLKLTVAEGQRHNGIANSGAGIDGITFGGLDSITVEDECTRIEWLEFKAQTNGGDAIFFDNSPSGANGLVHGIFVHSYWQNTNAGVRTEAPNTTIRNSFFTGGTSSGIAVDTGATGCSIENCTIFGNPLSGYGVQAGAGTGVSIRNTISVNHPTGDDFKLWADVDYFGYNLYDSVTGFDPDICGNCAGNNQLPPSTISRLFVDISSPTTPDLHLATWGHHAGNTGDDLSSSFLDDIDGVTRVDNWDIGADEGVSGTEPLPPVVISWKEVDPQ